MSIYTTEYFIDRSNKIHNSKYDYSKTVYINNYTKVIIICQYHGKFLQAPTSHLSGKGCSICGKNKQVIQRTSNIQKFIAAANKVHNYKFLYSNINYVNAHIKISITCKIHGNFLQAPNVHLRGSGCPKCKFNKLSKIFSGNLTDFIIKSNKIHNFKYKYDLSIYVNSETKLKIHCPIHGIFLQTPDNHLHNHGCSRCKHSKGERKIEYFLLKEHIIFDTQVKFIDCKNKRELPFDFAIYNSNNKLTHLIEYQGRQHYMETTDYFGSKSGNNNQKLLFINDQIKRDYCIKNNINLIEISYKDFNKIEEILSFKLKFFN